MEIAKENHLFIVEMCQTMKRKDIANHINIPLHVLHTYMFINGIKKERKYDVNEIKVLKRKGVKVVDIANQFNVKPRLIYAILSK